jgi:hypothetical protein
MTKTFEAKKDWHLDSVTSLLECVAEHAVLFLGLLNLKGRYCNTADLDVALSARNLSTLTFKF